jgi:hypothetical protein
LGISGFLFEFISIYNFKRSRCDTAKERKISLKMISHLENALEIENIWGIME